jgi:ATPase subunit of ABC transporter with duplicated ATPase domains
MTEVDTLLAALDGATCDDERAVLIAGASFAVLDQLRATLTYRTFMAQTAADAVDEAAAQAAFTRSLQDAADDQARLAIIRATDPRFVGEWQWQQRARPEDFRKRYMAMILGEANGT